MKPLAKKYQDRIAEEWQEADGYWISLKPGFKNGDDPIGVCHGIVEESKTLAYRKLRYSMVCDCKECKPASRPADRTEYCAHCRQYHNPPVWPADCFYSRDNLGTY